MWDRKIDRKSERKVRGIIVIMNKIIFELKILDKICKRYKYKILIFWLWIILGVVFDILFCYSVWWLWLVFEIVFLEVVVVLGGYFLLLFSFMYYKLCRGLSERFCFIIM